MIFSYVYLTSMIQKKLTSQQEKIILTEIQVWTPPLFDGHIYIYIYIYMYKKEFQTRKRKNSKRDIFLCSTFLYIIDYSTVFFSLFTFY